MNETLGYLFNSACLLIVCTACVAHVNKMQEAPFCERAGFVFTAAASFASAGWFLGKIVQWRGVMGAGPFVDSALYLGLAMIALAMMRGQLRRLLDRARGAWDGIDRRAHPITARELVAAPDVDDQRFQRRR